jgi:hypothetical protein
LRGAEDELLFLGGDIRVQLKDLKCRCPVDNVGVRQENIVRRLDLLPPWEEDEDGALSYEEEDTCHMRRRIHVI